MKKMSLLGPLELEVMKVVWECEDVAVADVVARVQSPRKLHHNTVMTVMKRLADKGFLEQYSRDGRSKGYRARISREALGQQYVDLLREQFFQGSTGDAIAAFLGKDKVTPKQLARLQKLLGEVE
ncbi:MAG: BlaI/MecI/CopY family transcriptional regulator [Planctomycetota bacterium]